MERTSQNASRRTAVKLAVSVLLLCWLASKLDARALLGALGDVSAGTGVAVLLAALVSPLLAAQRFKRVIAMLGDDVPFRALFKDVLVGRAFNLLLPTQVGGDVARALRTGARMRRAADAWASVLYERLIGLLVLALLPLAGLLVSPLCGWDVLRSALPESAWIAVALVTLGVVAAFCVLDRALPLAARLVSWIPPLSRGLREMADALRGRLASWPARLETAAWSLLAQLASLLPLALVGHASGLPALPAVLLVGVPAALILSTVPITLGGLGLRESLFVVMLGFLGVAPEAALALSLVWLVSLLPAALGGLLVLGLERTHDASLAEEV